MENNSRDEGTPNQKMKNQQFWQIWLPIIVTIVLCLAVLVIVVITAASGGNNVSKMADVAIIVLTAPLLAAFLVFIVLLFFINRSLSSFYSRLPDFFFKSQKTVSAIAAKIQSFAMLLTIPLIKTRSISTGTKTFINSTITRLRNRRNNE
jgi:flagellar basal body-associated protein FliL